MTDKDEYWLPNWKSLIVVFVVIILMGQMISCGVKENQQHAAERFTSQGIVSACSSENNGYWTKIYFADGSWVSVRGDKKLLIGAYYEIVRDGNGTIVSITLEALEETK